jgi:hypothetical protein
MQKFQNVGHEFQISFYHKYSTFSAFTIKITAKLTTEVLGYAILRFDKL